MAVGLDAFAVFVLCAGTMSLAVKGLLFGLHGDFQKISRAWGNWQIPFFRENANAREARWANAGRSAG